MDRQNLYRTASDRAPYRPDETATPAHIFIGVLLIAGLTSLVYLPVLSGNFLFDDNLLLTTNPLIKAPDGMTRFWVNENQPDYVPLTSSTLWLEWRLWGMHPTGYHVANLLLHIAACLLLWKLLSKLGISGGFLAALLFAIHPVNVESVAWVEQRKNTLSMVLFLLSILGYLRADEERRGYGKWYWLSLLAFALSMFSKGSVAILPVLLLLIVWWQQGTLNKRELVRSLPFFVVSAVLTPVIIWFVTHGTGEVVRNVTLTQRFLQAGSVVWFYLAKALVPIRLIFFYPLWQIEAGNWQWWAPLAATIGVTLVLIGQHRAKSPWLRSVIFAWGFYVVALAPVMGFSDPGYMKFSLVADHYQHIALIAVVTLAAAGWNIWHTKMRTAMGRIPIAAAVIGVAILSLLTLERNFMFRDPVALYEATLQENPNCWLAHNLLGNEWLAAGRTADAIAQLKLCLQLKPDWATAHVDLGAALSDAGRPEEAIEQYQQALKLKPDYVEAMYNLGDAMLKMNQFDQAIQMFRHAATVRPDFVEAYLGLGTASNLLGRPDDAIRYFQQALNLDPNQPQIYASLAVSYAQLQRPAEAVSAAQKAIDLARSQQQNSFIQQVQSWLNGYRSQAAGAQH